MADTLITIIPPSFPEGYCYPTTPQELINDAFEGAQATIPGEFQGVIVSDTQPDVDDQDKVWVKLNGSETNWFVFINGEWCCPHQTPAGGDERRIYVGENNAGGLWSYDGGDGIDPALATDTTGSFWAVDTNFAAIFPVGVGTFAGGGAVGLGGTGGEDEHVLTESEMPAHTHGMPTGVNEMRTNVAPGSGNNNDDSISGNGYYSRATFSENGGDEAHNNLPPYLGVYFIKRSARIYRIG